MSRPEGQAIAQIPPPQPKGEVNVVTVSTATLAPRMDGPLLSLAPRSPTTVPLTATPPPTATPVPSPTPRIAAMPLPTPPSPLIDYYVVEPGDTLGGISWAYDIPIDELVALNGLESTEAFLQIGQTLHVPLQVSRTGPIVTLLPDSEVVYSPAYLDFDVAAFVAKQGGYLATYSQRVNGVELSGAEVIERVARQYSVGPRVLLALLEFYGGWVTHPEPQTDRPLGPANPYGESLFLQLSWTANRINEGYYGYKRTGSIAVQFRDGSRVIIPARMNAGTVGLQNVLAVHTNWETWLTQVSPNGFIQTYRRLFGDPFALAVEPLIPIDLTQPDLRLPWEAGQTFYYSGGPHATYSDGSAWAAVDFGPPDILGSCFYSAEYVTAAAGGVVLLGRKGEIYLDLDGDGHLQTGWVLLYLHVVAVDDLTNGQRVAAGDPLGYASCEGGLANSSHLHFARRNDGEWMAADGPVPLVLSGWRVKAGLGPYEGEMVRQGVVKTACECWDEAGNGLVGE
jgi:LasA protease